MEQPFVSCPDPADPPKRRKSKPADRPRVEEQRKPEKKKQIGPVVIAGFGALLLAYLLYRFTSGGGSKPDLAGYLLSLPPLPS